MPFITQFEDILAWQEARKLTRAIYPLTQAGGWARDFGLKDQIQRVAVSAMTNITMVFEYNFKLKFARLFSLARRSTMEVQSLLPVVLDNDCVTKLIFRAQGAQAAKAKALIGGFKQSRLKRAATT